MANRKGRIGTIVAKDLADIIWAMNPELTNLSSVNEVRMNSDNSLARVYLSHLDAAKTDDLVNYCNIHKGDIRTELAHHLDVYKVPDLIFLKDDLEEQAAKIDAIINSWHKEAPKAEETKTSSHRQKYPKKKD